MAEYINRDDLLKAAWDKPTLSLSVYDIGNIKPVDVAPVRHGRNINAEWPSLFECSVCGWSDDDTTTGDTAVYNYCPNCGAKMDLEG